MDTDIDRRFMMVRMGYSYRIGEIEGALGLAQLENKDHIMSTRKENAAYLNRKLRKFSEYIQLPEFPDYMDHSFMMYPLVIRKSAPFTRKSLVEFLESNNIESRPMLPLLNQPIYLELFGNIEDNYPVAKWINHCGFYIGCHHGLGQQELDYIVDTFSNFLIK
jgi:dTDP-4-amino-4,6-dideoxygalactose transaminase